MCSAYPPLAILLLFLYYYITINTTTVTALIDYTALDAPNNVLLVPVHQSTNNRIEGYYSVEV